MVKTYQIPYKYEAMQFDGLNLDELKAFIGKDASIQLRSLWTKSIAIKVDGYLIIVDVGDYIIKDHLGELFVNSAERFSKHFKEVDDG